MHSQARRCRPPNQVRHPTDCSFAFNCSPPYFAVTQLLSATELWHTPTGTFTLLMIRPHGRTSAKPQFRLLHVPNYGLARLDVVKAISR